LGILGCGVTYRDARPDLAGSIIEFRAKGASAPIKGKQLLTLCYHPFSGVCFLHFLYFSSSFRQKSTQGVPTIKMFSLRILGATKFLFFLSFVSLGGRPRFLKTSYDGLARVESKARIKKYTLLFLDTKMAIEANTLLPAFIDARNPDRRSSIDEGGNLRTHKHLPKHLSSSDLILPPIGPSSQFLTSFTN